MQRFLVLCMAAVFISSEPPRKLDSINQEIEILSAQLHRLRLKAMQEDIDGQGYMLELPGQFADHIEQSEKIDHAVHKIEEKLRELKTQRDLLLNQQPSTPQSL